MNSTRAQSKSGFLALDDLRMEKLHAWHRERLAVVYVRQSTPQQVLDHQESCTGYLDHPFKNMVFETENDLPSLLANTGRSV